MNISATKVGEIFREAGAAFSQLGEMTAMLTTVGDSQPSGLWTEEETTMLKNSVNRFAYELNQLSQHIRKRTICMLWRIFKMKLIFELGTPCDPTGLLEHRVKRYRKAFYPLFGRGVKTWPPENMPQMMSPGNVDLVEDADNSLKCKCRRNINMKHASTQTSSTFDTQGMQQMVSQGMATQRINSQTVGIPVTATQTMATLGGQRMITLGSQIMTTLGSQIMTTLGSQSMTTQSLTTQGTTQGTTHGVLMQGLVTLPFVFRPFATQSAASQAAARTPVEPIQQNIQHNEASREKRRIDQTSVSSASEVNSPPMVTEPVIIPSTVVTPAQVFSPPVRYPLLAARDFSIQDEGTTSKVPKKKKRSRDKRKKRKVTTSPSSREPLPEALIELVCPNLTDVLAIPPASPPTRMFSSPVPSTTPAARDFSPIPRQFYNLRTTRPVSYTEEDDENDFCIPLAERHKYPSPPDYSLCTWPTSTVTSTCYTPTTAASIISSPNDDIEVVEISD